MSGATDDQTKRDSSRQRSTREHELRTLLRSADDLEAEFDAGDLTEDDYQQLKADYHKRIAEQMRRLEGEEPTPHDESEAPWLQRAGVWIGLVAFCIVTGLILAQFAGERGIDDEISGGIDAPSTRLNDCHDLFQSGQPVESLTCLDEVLLAQPEHLEALSYRGWYVVLAADSALQSGSETDAQELLRSALAFLDRAVEADPAYPPARTFRAVAYDRMGRPADVCTEVAELLALNPPEFFVQQIADVANRNSCV